MRALEALIEEVAMLKDRLAELERKSGNYVRKCKVKERKDGKVIVEDKTGFVSGPVTQGSMVAGEWTFDAPANPGAQGIIFCSDGETEGGVFISCLPDDSHPHASTEQGTMRLTGPEGVTITASGGAVNVTAAKIILNGVVYLGGEGGRPVSRKTDADDAGDKLIEGSARVFAVD